MAGEVVRLTVNRADNELAAIVNGVTVYDKKTENNPPLNDVVDLSAALTSGNNTLVLIGINWGGPATFQGSVTVGTFSTPFNMTLPSTPNGICWTQTFNIPF